MAMNHVVQQLEDTLTNSIGKSKEEWNYDEIKLYQEKISEIASSNFYGFDINPDLVKATKMNMVMNNDGSGNILRTDSLLPPHEWSDEFRTKLAEALKINKSNIRNSKTIDFFDVIVTNPPFGSKIPIKDPHILEQYELGHIWENCEGVWKKTPRLQSSVPPEQLFIERCLQFLKPSGRMGIVLPDAILGSPSLGYIRQWLIQNTYIIGSIDLHVDTFQPRNGTQTSVLILQKKTVDIVANEVKTGKMKDYNIFMTMAEKIGHDKRGTTIFKRDKYGNEILTPEINNVLILDETADGSKTIKSDAKIKVIDDQTLIIPQIFSKWKIQEGIVW